MPYIYINIKNANINPREIANLCKFAKMYTRENIYAHSNDAQSGFRLSREMLIRKKYSMGFVLILKFIFTKLKMVKKFSGQLRGEIE